MRSISSSIVRTCLREVQTGFDGQLPVDVVSVARNLGVAIVEAADLSVDGYVGLTKEGQLVIRYRRANQDSRNRFTIAHEIGHLVIARVTGVPITERKSRTGFDSEEKLANRLAAEILMPEFVLRNNLRRSSPRWGIVHKLRELFGVSASALLRRATEVSGIAAIFGRIAITSNNCKSAYSVVCDATNNPSLHLYEPFEQLVARNMVAANSSRFSVEAAANGRLIEIPCELRKFESAVFGSGLVYGWTKI
jgi:Zn-dependent peptidase ImmA (M78 family)